MSYKDHEPFDLAAGNFLIGQLEGLEIDNIINTFAGYVGEVLGKINNGKEATVYLCRAAEQAAGASEIEDRLLAAKMYRARKFRNFDNDRQYRNFGKVRDRRLAKAMRGKTRKGQKAFHSQWIENEWKCLTHMWELGVRVPRPYLHYADGILMAHVGDGKSAAPMLVNCRLEAGEADRLLDAILEDVAVMIQNHVVHGDLSAYNILYDGEHHTIIDMPQAVDVRVTPDAWSLFERDLLNIEKYFARYSLAVPVREMMREYF